MKKPLMLIISIALPFAAGLLGSLATMPNIPDWYASLEKPPFNPPNWLFGPVWSILYLFMGIAFYLIWSKKFKKSKQFAFSIFAAQLVLNTLWPLVFFGLHAPELALAVIVLLIASVIATMRAFWPISRLATYLLIPYLAWISFATILNTSIAILN